MTHQFTCSACSFQVRSENDDEIVDIVRNHAREMHDANMSEADVRDGWTEVRGKADH